MRYQMNYRRLLNKNLFRQALEFAEKEVYLAAFEHARENKTETARLLNVSRNTVIEKLKKYRVLLNS